MLLGVDDMRVALTPAQRCAARVFQNHNCSYTSQRISCVLARAVAWELATAMQLTRVRDARDD